MAEVFDSVSFQKFFGKIRGFPFRGLLAEGIIFFFGNVEFCAVRIMQVKIKLSSQEFRKCN